MNIIVQQNPSRLLNDAESPVESFNFKGEMRQREIMETASAAFGQLRKQIENLTYRLVIKDEESLGEAIYRNQGQQRVWSFMIYCSARVDPGAVLRRDNENLNTD